LTLIVLSIVGVTLVVRFSAPGISVVLATTYIPAGTTVTDDMITDGRVASAVSHPGPDRTDVVGRIAGADINEGDLVMMDDLEPSSMTRVEVSVPLGVVPPESLTRGSNIDLWAIDAEGISPPVEVAAHATVLSMSQSSFGGDTIATILVNAMDIDRVLSMMGTSRLLVATGDVVP
jgi:hypothetical protein